MKEISQVHKRILKKKIFNRFIEQGFPNKRIEDWKFSDLNQIIKKNI